MTRPSLCCPAEPVLGLPDPAPVVDGTREDGLAAMKAAGEDWQVEAKRRKKWWRDEIASKEGYNALLAIIPRVRLVSVPL
jgi:hypothetical protein